MALVNPRLGQKRRLVKADELYAIAEITGFAAPDQTLRQVPLLSWVSAGKLVDTGEPTPVADLPLLAFADLGRGDYFALKVAGDSMDRVSPDGSIIIVDRADRERVAGRFYVFARRGEATYKRWRRDPPRLEPFSTNPANEPIFVSEDGFEVVGRVRRTVLDL
jgi:SOS-response transcriptional repressor LexA